MRTLLAGVAVAVLGAGFGFGFLAGRLTAAPGASAATRSGERPVHVAAVRDGNLTLRPTGITCGLQWVVGTHADQQAQGQFCRLALAVTNIDSAFHDFVPARQRLVSVEAPTGGSTRPAGGPPGRTYGPSLDAMRIERQPDVATLGARDRLDLDIWFDVPATAVVTGVRLVGDDDPSGVGTTVTAPHAPGGVYVPLPRSGRERAS